MENGKSILSNPWVWAGVGGVVLLLFVSRGSSGGSSQLAGATLSADSANYATSISAATALGEASYQNNATVAGYFYNALDNLSQFHANTNAQIAEGTSGVISSIATQQSLLAADISNNDARVQQTGIQGVAQISVSGNAAAASQAAAQASASANVFNSIAGAIANLGKSTAAAVAA